MKSFEDQYKEALDFINTHVIFKSCDRHTELRYAGDKCPVCTAEKKIDFLTNQVESLQILQATATAE